MDAFAQQPEPPAAAHVPARSRSIWLRLALAFAALAGSAIFVYEAFIFSYPYRYSDFAVYYAAAQVAAAGGNPYERSQVGAELTQLGIDSNIQEYLYSSSFLVAMRPLLLLSVREAHRVFMGLSFLALAASMLLLWRALNRRRARAPASAWLIGLLFVWFAPVWSNLTLTQSNALVLLLLCGCFYLAMAGRDFGAGAALAGAVMLKLTPALLCLYFLFQRRWRALAGTAAAAAVLELISWLYFRSLLDINLPAAVLEQGPRKLLYWSNLAFPAMIVQPFGDGSAWLGPLSLAAGALVAAATIWICWKRRSTPGAGSLVFGLLVTAFLLASTYLYEHHMIQLLIPLAVIGAALLGPLASLPRGRKAVLLAGFSLSFLLMELDYWRFWQWLDMESWGWWAHPATWGLLLFWGLQMWMLASPSIVARLAESSNTSHNKREQGASYTSASGTGGVTSS